MANKKPKSEGALKFMEREFGTLTLGRALAAIRETEDISLAAFAKRLGVSRTHLHDVEKGKRGVSPERAARWARVLGHPARVFVALALQDAVRDAGLKLKVRVEAA